MSRQPRASSTKRSETVSSAQMEVPQRPDIEELVRIDDLVKLLKVSRTTLWRWVQGGYLQKPLRLSANIVAWRRSTVADFLRTRENG
jgi:predicted DNA-binding transcriptional regulator AlpA